MSRYDKYAMSFAALNLETVTEGHAGYCRENGHAMHTEDGVQSIFCPRCGDLTEQVAPVRILMTYADMNEQSYGIAFRSTADHHIEGARHNPGSLFTVTVWLNVFRSNPFPEKAQWRGVGMVGGPGKYLGADNKGTDEPYSVTTSAQASVLSAHPIERTPIGDNLKVGGSVVLVLPDHTELGPFVIAQGSLADPHMVAVA